MLIAVSEHGMKLPTLPSGLLLQQHVGDDIRNIFKFLANCKDWVNRLEELYAVGCVAVGLARHLPHRIGML